MEWRWRRVEQQLRLVWQIAAVSQRRRGWVPRCLTVSDQKLPLSISQDQVRTPKDIKTQGNNLSVVSWSPLHTAWPTCGEHPCPGSRICQARFPLAADRQEIIRVSLRFRGFPPSALSSPRNQRRRMKLSFSTRPSEPTPHHGPFNAVSSCLPHRKAYSCGETNQASAAAGQE